MSRLLSLAALGLRDLRAAAYPVLPESSPDGRGAYPLDLRSAAASCQPGAGGVVMATTQQGRSYHHPVSASLYALARHTEAGAMRAAPGAAEFLAQAHHLRRLQDHNGGWRYPVPVNRYRVAPGWYSAMAQGLAASVLIRAYDMAGDQSYLDAAGAAVTLLVKPVSAGGCADYDRLGRPFLEECPSEPPSHILNGAIFALIGLAEHERRLGGGHSRPAAERLAAQQQDYDTGYWSRYDLRFPAPATRAYHTLHISLLEVAERLLPGYGFSRTAARWRSYLRRPGCRLRAAAGKARFALVDEGRG